ncbi:MAG TPA: polyphosphate polymerase domain-containing protein [Prolixibacteraceae bacterium]|nr:polyphosphate polymerase domain-containing protein [Prolixibacteraceae bacterium]
MIEGYTTLDEYRFKRKYTTNVHYRGFVDVLIRQNPALFKQAYLPRQVNNVYFDTPGLDCFFDNLFGLGNRWKARIRWYGTVEQFVQSPVLEFKIKKGHVNTKRSWILSPLDFTGNLKDPHFFRNIFLNSDLPDDVRSRMLGLQAVLLNSYNRKYYVSGNKKIRLTVDSNLQYRDVRSYIHHSKQVFEEKEKLVIELKYPKSMEEDAISVSNLFPFRLGKNSKFVSGMAFIRPGVAD